MKKLLTMAAVITVAASMAYAASNEVYSVNVVGFQKKELPPGNYILTTCNFETGSSNTLLSIFGTNTLTQSDSLLSCDRVLLYDAVSQTYQAWAQWTDGVFYKANNGTEWEQSISGDPEVPVGSGFFIAPSASATTTNVITYVGDVVMTETQQIAITEGYQILSYPFSSDIALQDTSFYVDGAAASDSLLNCDRVFIYENGAYQAYAVWTDGQWYKANNGAEWEQSILASNTLTSGQAFFYNAQAGITWNETNKYLQSLSQ